MAICDFKKLTRSMRHATRGARFAAKEQNFRIQMAIASGTVFMGLFFGIKTWEAAILIIMITFVLVLEVINSIFEKIVDILEPRVHPYAKTIKDMMASAVLIASVGATFIGLIIFWPYIKNIIRGF